MLIPEELADFISADLTDNHLAALAVACGQPVELVEAVALAAGSRAIYDLVSIESRGLQKIDQCASLWREALAYFEAAEAAWIGVPQDGKL